jgi:16S rRNA (cytidine1402-2'-O)-methyltransferase
LSDSGTLYVVATPIGNLGDLSARARDVLASVDLIAAEDTRHTKQLLQACGVDRPLTSLHEHNEAEKSQALITRLMNGESIALVSDAGTPLISDPGFDLVGAARARGLSVVAVPGPCAAIAALSVAGLPTDRFVFEGFLPAKSGARRARLEELVAEPRTLVFYEAPHRLVDLLRDLAAAFGPQRKAAVSRELTKRFETTYAGALQDLLDLAERNADMSRGEIVVIVAGDAASGRRAESVNAEQLLRALLEELPPAQAAKITARLTGEKRADLYEQASRLSASRRSEAGE